MIGDGVVSTAGAGVESVDGSIEDKAECGRVIGICVSTTGQQAKVHPGATKYRQNPLEWMSEQLQALAPDVPQSSVSLKTLPCASRTGTPRML